MNLYHPLSSPSAIPLLCLWGSDTTTMTMATGDEVDDDGDGATDDGVTGDDDDDDCNDDIYSMNSYYSSII
jgi:hypothetical protein